MTWRDVRCGDAGDDDDFQRLWSVPESDGFSVGDTVVWFAKTRAGVWRSPADMLDDSDIRNGCKGKVLRVESDAERQRVVLSF